MNKLKNYKIILFVLFLVVTFVLQTAFLYHLGSPWRYLDLPVVTMALFIFTSDFKRVLTIVLPLGIMMDIYSGLPFGIFLLSYFLAAVIMAALFFNFFTNRSFYAFLATGLIGVTLSYIVAFLFNGFFYLIGWSDFFTSVNFWSVWMYRLITNLFLLIFYFSIVNYFSQRFKPIFLRS